MLPRLPLVVSEKVPPRIKSNMLKNHTISENQDEKPSNESSHDIVMSWIDDSDIETLKKKELDEFEKHKQDLNAREESSTVKVRGAIDKMEYEQEQLVHRITLAKWKEVLRLHKSLTLAFGTKLNYSGFEHTMYETFFRAAPNGYVSKPRFISIMRSLFCKSNGDKVMGAINAMEHCFDISRNSSSRKLNNNEIVGSTMDWKHLICNLRFLQRPNQAFADQLKWCFAIYSSEGCFDLGGPGHISTIDMYSVFQFGAGSPHSTKVIATKVRDAMSRLPAVKFEKKKVNLTTFNLVLQQKPMQVLLENATPYTTFYHELCSPVVRDFIARERTIYVNKNKIVLMIKRSAWIRKTSTIAKWKFHVVCNVKCRNAIHQALLRAVDVNLRHTMKKWKGLTLRNVAAIDIQRLFRGFSSRKMYGSIVHSIEAANCIQRAFKRQNFFVEYMARMRLYSKNAIVIQRVFRGRKGRLLARSLLFQYYEKEMQNLELRKQAILSLKRRSSSKKIKSAWKQYLHKKKLRLAEEIREAEAEVAADVHELMLEASKQTTEYQENVSEFYRQEKEKREYQKHRSIIDAKEKIKVVNRRRERDWADWRLRKQEEERLKLVQEQEHLEAWNREWLAKIESRKNKRRQKSSTILSVGSLDDIRSKKELMQRIKQRAKEISTEYKKSGISIANSLIQERAHAEIVEEEVAVEEQNAIADWEAARIEYDENAEERKISVRLAEIEANKDARELSACQIQHAFRGYYAKRKLRSMIETVYAKEFDVISGNYFYRNYRTGAITKVKPICLGKDDLDLVDKWVIMTDPSASQFYYNPCTLDQSWEFPAECCLPCSVCASNFCSSYDANGDTLWCLDCHNFYRTGHEIMHSLDGAMSNCFDTLERLRYEIFGDYQPQY